jgi:hypothetical protein
MVNRYQRVEGSQCDQLQGVGNLNVMYHVEVVPWSLPFFLECMALKMNAQRYETSVTIYQSTHRNVIAHFVLVPYQFLFSAVTFYSIYALSILFLI